MSTEPAPPPEPADIRFAQLRGIGGETLRYGAVAGFSFVWILGTSALWVELAGLPERLGVAIALLTALVINFTLLRIFVWPGQEAAIGAQFAATAATSLSFRGLEFLLFLLLVGPLGLFYLVATAVSVLSSSVAKFLIYRNVVFRRRGPSG